MGLRNSHSIMGANARFLYNAYKMNAPSVDVVWKERCEIVLKQHPKKVKRYCIIVT